MGICPLCLKDDAVGHWLKPKAASARVPAPGYNISNTKADDRFAVEFCSRCGFGFNPDRPRVEQLEQAYADYGDQPEYRFEQDNRIATGREFLSALPWDAGERRGKRLLDVGCSVGYYTKAAQQLGYDALGVEPSKWAAQWGEKNLGVRILNGSFLDCALAEDAYDAVLMADVIEHASGFGAMLARARACLKPGGFLLLLTPDIGSAAARLLGRRWWSLKPEHVLYFSRRSLAAALESEGFSVTRMATAAHRFSLAYWLFLATGAPRALRLPLLRRASVRLDFGDQLLCLAVKR